MLEVNISTTNAIVSILATGAKTSMYDFARMNFQPVLFYALQWIHLVGISPCKPT